MNKQLNYPCYICDKKDCEYRQQVTEKDFKSGVSKYCDHGFTKIVMK